MNFKNPHKTFQAQYRSYDPIGVAASRQGQGRWIRFRHRAKSSVMTRRSHPRKVRQKQTRKNRCSEPSGSLRACRDGVKV